MNTPSPPLHAPHPPAFGLRPATFALVGGLVLVLALVLSGCSLPRTPTAKTTYDLGPLPIAMGEPSPRSATTVSQTAWGPQAPLRLAATTAPAALASTEMGYRLVYAQPLQPRTYTLARWSMAPAQLVHQRLQSALLADGWQLSTYPGPDTPELQVDMDGFEHVFDTADHSVGRVLWRVSLRQGQATLAQTRIAAQAPAPTPDAAGGAQALATATDSATAQVRAWLAAQRPPAARTPPP